MMKKLLSLIAISTLSATSATSVTSFLNTNINTTNHQLKQQINYLSPIIEDKGINKIIVLNQMFEFRIYINHQTLKKWNEYPKEKTKDFICDDLKSNFLTEGKIPNDYYQGLANFFAINTYQMLNNIPHSSIYGIVFGNIYMTNPQSVLPITSTTGVQSSPITDNSSYTQENFVYFGHNHLNVYISRNQWETMVNIGKNHQAIIKILNNFPQDPAWNKSEISSEYLAIMTAMIIANFDEINNKFQNSQNHGWVLKGNTIAECLAIESQSA